MPTLATPKDCTGCSACYNICPHNAITISSNMEGFLMPDIDYNKCVECRLCEKACPIVNQINLKYPEAEDAYAFWDNETRTKSSSGGAFSAIARWVIDNGGVVFGAAWTKDGFHCQHKMCTNADELADLRGSKYLQSDIQKTFCAAREALRNGNYVLFTGTPCQIAGLRSFLIKPYDRLITVDIVCHGVPSNTLFFNYIKKLITEYPKYRNASGFHFRNLQGWGISPSLKISKKREVLTGIPNIYMGAFEKAAIFRESCYDCRFNGISRTGDITIADFWGIGLQGIPFHKDVTKGVSLVLINTDKGKEIFKSLDNCFMEKRPIKEALKYNHNLIASSSRPDFREEAIVTFNDSEVSLKGINDRFNFVSGGWKGVLRNTLIRTGIFWTIKSIINKYRSL